MPEIAAVTLDFYLTLVRHRTGQGRGATLMEYLAGQGLSSLPWEHQVLYDVFGFYGETNHADLDPVGSERFWTDFTFRLFGRLGVCGPTANSHAAHAASVREILGPSSLTVFEDVVPVLDWLRQRGVRVGVISNWQCGLAHFCRELGILSYFDFVLASAEVGCEKPDLRIFEMAVRRHGVPPGQILHVGDHPIEDARGALAAGMRTAVLNRKGAVPLAGVPTLRSLSELSALFA